MKCRSCGADNAPNVTACNYCGSHLPLNETAKRPAVFARLKASPEYARRQAPERLARLPKVGAFQKAFMFIFFGIFICASLFMFVVILGIAGIFGFAGFQMGGRGGGAFSMLPMLMAVVPFGMAGFGVFMFLQMRKKMSSLENDPVQAVAVVVVDKRNHVSGGSGNSSASTQYFVTCEAEDGTREEFQVWDGTLYGRMSADDAGVLFTRSGYGLDFDRVAV